MQALAVGHCTLDQIGLVDHFARDDEEVQMPTYSVQGGGAAATAAVALARWGVTTRFAGKVGDDDRGALIERTLRDEGVCTQRIAKDTGRISQTRFVVVEATTGRRHTYFTPGDVSPLGAQDVDAKWVDDHELLVVDSRFPKAQAPLIERAKQLGVPVVCESNRDRSTLGRCVEGADVVVTSERLASAFTGVGSLEGICEALLEKGPEIAIITLGDEGAVGMSRESSLVRVKAEPVDVVDVTGASDVFLGAVALGVLEGWELEKMVRFANAAAGHACTAPGGRSAIADRQTLESMAEINSGG